MSGRQSDVFESAAGLEAERQALHRRLSALDEELFSRGLAERAELARRIATVERNVDWLALKMGLVPAKPEAAVAVTAPVTAPITAPVAPVAPVALVVGEALARASQPVPAPEPPAPAAQAAVSLPQEPAPRIVGQRQLTGAAPLWEWNGAEWVVAEWAPEGTMLPVTGRLTPDRTEVYVGRQLRWVEHEHLAAEAPPAREQVSAQIPTPVRAPASAPLLTPVSAPRTPPRPPVWTRPGFVPKLMALVGAAVTLIGVGFLLVLAAQLGYYGPEARTISALVLAGVLVWLAFVVRRRDPENVGAPILAATGIASAYLSVVASTVFYGWFQPIAGVSAAAVVGLAGLLLARRWDNEWMALVAVLGSLALAPWIGARDIEWTVALMLVVTAVTLYFEHESDWRLFPFARVLPTTAMLLMLASATPVTHPNFPLLVGMTVGLAWLGLLSAVIAPAEPSMATEASEATGETVPTVPGVKGLKAATGQLISIGLLVPMVLPVTQAGLRITSPWQSALVLSLVAVPLIVVGLTPAIHERVRWAAVPLGAGLLMLAGLAATEQQGLGVMALGFGAVYLAIAVKSRSLVNLLVGALLGGGGVLGWLTLTPGFLLEYFAARQGPEQIAQSLVGIAVVVLGGMAARVWLRELTPGMLYWVWGLAIAMGSLAVVFTGAYLGALAGAPAAGFQGGHMVVTSAWMVLCIVFLRRGLATKKDARVWLRLAQTIAGLAVAKLFLFDLSALVAVARVGAFLVAGLLLLFVGTRYAKAWERVHGTPDADEADSQQEPSATALPDWPAPPEPPVPTVPPESETAEASGAQPASFSRPS